MRTKVITFLIFCLLGPSSVYAQEVGEVLSRAKKAVFSLTSVKTKGKTVTGGVDVTYSRGAIDYVHNRFFVIENKGDKIMSRIYLKDNTTYVYNGVLDSWHKFGQDVSIFKDLLNRKKLFAFFPVDFAKTGLSLEITGEEEVEGVSCHVIVSKIADLEKTKQFMVKFLDDFFPAQLSRQMRQNQALLDNFLNSHTQDLEYIQWISKDKFWVVKAVKKYRQATGPGESIAIGREVIYYDFNQPVTIEIPEAAKEAALISAEEMGLGR